MEPFHDVRDVVADNRAGKNAESETESFLTLRVLDVEQIGEEVGFRIAEARADGFAQGFFLFRELRFDGEPEDFTHFLNALTGKEIEAVRREGFAGQTVSFFRKPFMTGRVVQAVEDAAFPVVRNEHVGIARNAVLETCAAAEETVGRIEFFIAHQAESVFGRFESGAEEFGVAGAEPVVPCAPDPDDDVPVLPEFFVDQQFPGFIG